MGKSDKSVKKQERRFSPEQYKMLKRCSVNKDMTEWNEWREKNSDEEILMENADLECAYLENANLLEAHLENTNLVSADLENADLECAHLENADLRGAYLENTKMTATHLENAKLFEAHLEHADLFAARLQGASFVAAIVDGTTSIIACGVDRKTDFRDVGLHNMRVESGTKQLLEYNIRRMNWEKWYKEHWFWRWPVQLFWAMSDYGMSTKRVVGVFFLLAFLFAAVYANWAYWAPPGIISNLEVQPEIGEAVWHYFFRALVRPVYFSIVTMTTLGFGDMYANKGSIAGHVILAVQVILGYVLLGALITRFAVLFTAGGPAGKFAKQKKKVDSVSPDNGIRGQASTE